MKDKIKSYLQEHYPINRIFGKETDTHDENMGFNQFRVSKGQQLLLALLKFSPYICLVSFLGILIGDLIPFQPVSTFFDTNQFWLDPLMTVSVSGLIGYGTNYIAIRMLFRPVERRPIWGQGLIPAQRDRIIYTLAGGIHKHILNSELIHRRIEESGLVNKINQVFVKGTSEILRDEELRAVVKTWLSDALHDFAQQEKVKKEIYTLVDKRLEKNLEGGVKQFLLQTYKRYNKQDYDEVLNKIVADLPKVAVQVMEKLETELDRLAAYVRLQKGNTEKIIMQVLVDAINRIDIPRLLRKQMEHFDESRLEKMVWEATNEQLLYIQYLGTILGVFGGLLIWKTELMIISFAIVFGLLYCLDWILYSLKSKKAIGKLQKADSSGLPK